MIQLPGGSGQEFMYPVFNISYQEETLVIQDVKLSLSPYPWGSNCLFLYDFRSAPIPHVNVTQLSLLISSGGSSFFDCGANKGYDSPLNKSVFARFYNYSSSCKEYNLYYTDELVEKSEGPYVLKCSSSGSNSLWFIWKLSFSQQTGFALLSAGFSHNWLQPDCFGCRITGPDCDIAVQESTCPCTEDCSVASSGKMVKIIIGIVSLAVFLLCSLMLLTWIRFKHRRTKLSAEKTILPFGTGRVINLKESEQALMSPLYPLSSIIKATDNFSNVNKLGEGGFGPVYKGILIDGQEIAVKRLAAKSGQGLKEFENEIILIAKLQHRNLVRLLGYCMHGEEKILIYEYMPNKGLDYFLYDTTRRAQLDWSTRLHIIEGISQGLLYLHKHSRLRIIHRDLKASNILLDADMNPKISDFGLARIFDTNETEANTNRIVGTYGYMSPEYAAEGLFSIKSDVFSFGVLLLEIVSGTKNASYHRDGNTLNLLGYAWELYKEAKLLELLDPSFDENCPKHEISRCIHIALMCVQEKAIDRPNMSTVIAMLSSDSAIADPKQPAFFNVKNPVEEEFHSINEATMTTINGR